LRRWLDLSAGTILNPISLDTECIKEIIIATAECFQLWCDNKTAKTALKAIGLTVGRDRPLMFDDFESLPGIVRSQIEKVLTERVKQSKQTLTAAEIFDTLAFAAIAPTSGRLRQVADLIVKYVKEVADQWNHVGLSPSRARKPDDPAYASRFHRFADLVLTMMAEPSAERHDGKLDEKRRRILREYYRLSPDDRSGVAPTLPRRDTEWLVSDDHIKRALSDRIRKMGSDTP
jgi:hypothetical protein